MDHEAYEKEMIDTVNRHAEEQKFGTHKSTVAAKKSVFTKTDVKRRLRGINCVVAALVTAFEFGLSVATFIEVASATGYEAVVLFIAAIAELGLAFILLYALGITRAERQGDSK